MPETTPTASPNVQRGAVLWYYTQSAVHAGAGSVLSSVDLPIQREVHTGHPIVQSSGVKGALREAAHSSNVTDPRVAAFFGPETDHAHEHSGLALIQEARVALFPVRSMKGIFAWVTCGYVLQRLARDVTALQAEAPPDIPAVTDASKAFFPDGSQCKIGSNVVLEEFRFQSGGSSAEIQNLAEYFSKYVPSGWWSSKVKTDILVVHDDVFTQLVRTKTEVTSHIKMKHGVVDATGPRYKESLPPDTLLYSTVTFPPLLAKQHRDAFKEQSGEPSTRQARTYLVDLLNQKKVLYLGGDRTNGLGRVAVTVTTGGPDDHSGSA